MVHGQQVRSGADGGLSRALRVGFDAGPLLDPPTGVGRYTAELSSALTAEGVTLERFAVAWRGRADPAIHRLRVPARLMRSLWRRFDAPRIDRLTGEVDVVHGTNFVLPPSTHPGVVTVHDLSFYRDDVFPGGERLRDLVPWSVQRARAVIVPTEAIGREVEERYPVGGDKVFVTPEGVSPHFFGATPLADTALARMGIARPFALAVGTLEPRKNLARLIAAWQSAGGDLEGWSLVLAGPRGWGPELPEAPGVVLTGRVGEETLPGLLAAAAVFCYPSSYEGFGLPPLEAMAAGTPVLAGSYPAASEVLGDAAEIVDPRDADALSEGLVRLGTDEELRSRLILKGRARATAFTWTSTARATVRAYLAATDT